MKVPKLSSIKRHTSILLLCIVAILLILLIIWWTDRIIMEMDQYPPELGGVTG